MEDVVRAPLIEAERIRQELQRRGAIDFTRVPESDDRYLYIPVNTVVDGYEVVERALPRKQAPVRDLREALADELTAEELADLKTAYDLVGDIAILEIDEELRHREGLIAQTLLKIQPAINVVVRKDSAHSGELRLQEYVWLAGEKRFETDTVEHGITLSLDIRKTYYSVRSSTERKRIADEVGKGERVLVMFSGIAPFVCVIGKHSSAKEVVGVELNPDAHRFAEQNIKQNNVVNASVIHGDVRTVVPELGSFDRVVMPLPHTAEDFLDVAVPACTGMIHLYHFATEEEVEAFAETIPDRISQLGRRGRVRHIQKCGNLAPGVHRWCLDIEVES